VTQTSSLNNGSSPVIPRRRWAVVICALLLSAPCLAETLYSVEVSSLPWWENHESSGLWNIIYPVDRPNKIELYGEDHELVGALSWENGVVSFEGDIDKSARIFFEALLSDYCLGKGPR